VVVLVRYQPMQTSDFKNQQSSLVNEFDFGLLECLILAAMKLLGSN
jgi:hypothetical protein